MEYMILDSSGSAVASFADDLAARATFHAIVAVEPDAADHLVLVEYDDNGMPVGDALMVWDLPPAFTVDPSEFVQRPVSKTVIRQVKRTQNLHFPGLALGGQVRVGAAA